MRVYVYIYIYNSKCFENIIVTMKIETRPSVGERGEVFEYHHDARFYYE